VHYLKTGEKGVRVGIAAGKKIGQAVARNLARRLLREAARKIAGRFPEGYDFVLLARQPMLDSGMAEVKASLERLVGRITRITQT
jgi:ribonuclease P protein component